MSQSGLSRARPESAAKRAAGQDVRSPRRVLVVDDDPAICSALSEVLQEEGFEVASATDGRAALDQLRTGPAPAVIVLDLMMPVMDGWDFRHNQLQDPGLRDIPVVIVTAAGFSPETVHTQFGDVTLIPKPVPLLDLLDALGRVCSPNPAAA
jgi:CheY-like chemotaxis protein